MESIPDRLAILERFTNQSGMPNWKADLSADSLDALGDWFVTRVETRPRTATEIQEIVSRAPYPVPIPDYELTNRTFSLAIDIGMYFAMTLKNTFPHLTWEQPLHDKQFIEYGQPVLRGFGAVPLNPVAIAITLAYGIARRTKSGRRLRELYDYWSKDAEAHRSG
jgi:hypothetical protein